MAKLLDRFLNYEMKMSELIGTVILLGIPYGLIGIVWSLTHTEHLREMHGPDMVVSFLGSIVCWPVLIFFDICMT